MKKQYYIYLSIMFLIFGFVHIKHVWSWDNDTTHRDISQIAVEKSALGSQINLLRNLGYSNGFQNMLTWSGKTRNLLQWIQEGGETNLGTLFLIDHYT